MSPERVLVDTGVLLAAADADDRWHHEASSVLQARPAEELVLPTPVATEAAWLIGSRLGPTTEAAFVASVAAGEFAVTERLGITTVASVDRRDLLVVRPAHCEGYTLIP